MEFNPVPEWKKISAEVSALLDNSYKAKQDEQPRRPYLGGSAVGRDCEREIAYQYHNTPRDQSKTGFSGQLYRIFDRGHKGEERVAEYLRVAGFELVTEKQDGRQFGFSALDGRFKGHIDGVILSGPLSLPYPMLWENKILNNKSFNDLYDHGLKKSKPVYYTQVQLYMAYMDLANAMFTAENADTCEVFTQIVPFDPAHAQAMSDRAVRIVQSQAPEELPRCTSDKSDFRCKFCDFSERCWGQVDKQPKVTPAWLKKDGVL